MMSRFCFNVCASAIALVRCCHSTCGHLLSQPNANQIGCLTSMQMYIKFRETLTNVKWTKSACKLCSTLSVCAFDDLFFFSLLLDVIWNFVRSNKNMDVFELAAGCLLVVVVGELPKEIMHMQNTYRHSTNATKAITIRFNSNIDLKWRISFFFFLHRTRKFTRFPHSTTIVLHNDFSGEILFTYVYAYTDLKPQNNWNSLLIPSLVFYSILRRLTKSHENSNEEFSFEKLHQLNQLLGCIPSKWTIEHIV